MFFIKKHVTLFVSLLKMKKYFFTYLFLCLLGFSLGQYCRKSLAKNEGFGKNIKGRGGDGHIGGGVYRRGVRTFCTLQ